MPAHYRAWLSTATAGPSSFMTRHPGPYVLPGGEMIATSWTERVYATGTAYIQVRFRQQDCRACAARMLCTQATQAARTLKLQERRLAGATRLRGKIARAPATVVLWRQDRG